MISMRACEGRTTDKGKKCLEKLYSLNLSSEWGDVQL